MKRIYIVRIIGMFCMLLAVICGIGVIGSVGAMEWGAPIDRCTVQAIGFGIASGVFGKLGTALVLK